MNATATKPSTIVDDLYVYRIDARHFGVESRRELFAEHIMYMDHAGEIHCDSDCPAYRRDYRCSHVASTLRFLREEAENDSKPWDDAPLTPEDGPVYTDGSCCDCQGWAYPMNRCICPCHSLALDAGPTPAQPDTDAPMLPLAVVPVRISKVTGKPIGDLAAIFPKEVSV